MKSYFVLLCVGAILISYVPVQFSDFLSIFSLDTFVASTVAGSYISRGKGYILICLVILCCTFFSHQHFLNLIAIFGEQGVPVWPFAREGSIQALKAKRPSNVSKSTNGTWRQHDTLLLKLNLWYYHSMCDTSKMPLIAKGSWNFHTEGPFL